MLPMVACLSLLLLVSCVTADAPKPGGGTPTIPGFSSQWADPAVWGDGLAEVAVYDATRTIYGQSRAYEATLYTNTEHLDPDSFTKAKGPSGWRVFKFHTRDDIPTENYAYHYSTMAYIDADTLAVRKLDMGSQEDCGASFKQFRLREADRGKLKYAWEQYSYFPDEGRRKDELKIATGDRPATYIDALPAVLRGYPFDAPVEMTINLVPEQTTTKWSPVEPVTYELKSLGEATVDTPRGPLGTHRVRLVPVAGGERLDYWFATDPALQHVMVKHVGPMGQTYLLKSVERRAYWER